MIRSQPVLVLGSSSLLRFPQVLAQGDMFLNSSVSEGLPLAIIEASRAGLVVVATDVGGTQVNKPYSRVALSNA